MTNRTGMTRRDAVLVYLQRHKGEWVPGLELMNERVGGLRAGARIYELRKAGWHIETRSSRISDVDEYRYMGRLDDKPEEPPLPFVSWTPDRGGFKALFRHQHLQVFCSLDRQQWYWMVKGLSSGGPGKLDDMKRAAILAVVAHR